LIKQQNHTEIQLDVEEDKETEKENTPKTEGTYSHNDEYFIFT